MDMAKEIEALERVLFRLASVNDDRLITVLDTVLPQLLRLFPDSLTTPIAKQLNDKVIEVLTHIKTRLHAISTPKLPLLALGMILKEDHPSVFTLNFTFLFIEIGLPAATHDNKMEILSIIFEKLPQISTSLQNMFYVLILSSFPITNIDSLIKNYSHESLILLLDFILDLVLYQPTRDSTTYGLMPARIERLRRVKVMDKTQEELYTCQSHALQFVKQLERHSPLVWILFVVGTASFHHTIKMFSEDQLHRLLKDPLDPSPLEDLRLCRSLMCLVLGSQDAQKSGALQGSETVLLRERIRLSDAGLLTAIRVLQASKTATNILPYMLQVLCQLMFGTEPSRPQNITNSIKIAGIRLCEWTFLHSDVATLMNVFGPVLLPTLQRVLMDPNADTDTTNSVFWREFRQEVYASVAVLATRAPSLVTTSEQTFQVVLVRCLIEEENRSGAHALQAFASLRMAFASPVASEATKLKIQSEMIGLLRGIKLFDKTKKYERVRVAITEWAWTLLTSHSIPDEKDVELRLAILPLGADQDDAVRNAAHKALYVDPLPNMEALVDGLTCLFDHHKDLKKTHMRLDVIEQCILLCQYVMRKQVSYEGVKVKQLVEYFVETLLSPLDWTQRKNETVEYTSLCQHMTRQLLALVTVVPTMIVDLLAVRQEEVARMMLSVSTDRVFLLDLARLMHLSSRNAPNTIMTKILHTSLTTLSESSSTILQVCGSLYLAGTCISVLELSPVVNGACSTISSILTDLVTTISNFALLPRGEEAQNSLLDRLRSILDAIQLMRNWNSQMAVTLESGVAILSQLKCIFRWKLASLASDGHLKQKLSVLRRIALETTASIVTDLHCMKELLRSPLQELLDAVLELGAEVSDPELQFSVAHTLVAFGSCHDFISTEETLARTLLTQIVQNHCTSRFPAVRRSASTWLLCCCAAGLVKHEPRPLSLSSWSHVFQENQNVSILITVHEFFVSMLNDTDNVAKECCVKGLAYLRLECPNQELGDQFSGSLFRRLRCFRAFAPTSGGGVTGENIENGGEETPSVASESAASTAAGVARSTSTQDTVENAAYREVSNIAADIGDPDLMYALLYLSTTDPVWEALTLTYEQVQDPSSTWFAFIKVDQTFRTRVLTHSKWMSETFLHCTKLVPWLFLLKHHSNPKVAEVMNKLWVFVKGEAIHEKSMVHSQRGVIFAFLLQKLETSRNFKYRESACMALLEVLNGAEPEDVRTDFVTLWKLTSRSVDDIMEAVAVAGLKLFKYLGELSLRVATKDDACRQELLEYLTTDAMASKNVVCRTLSIDLLLRLLKQLDSSAVQPRLVTLSLQLVEYLSSLEMPELQYAQFHVDKKEQLERLRVSLSQSGPVGQLLEQCTIHLKALSGTEVCIAMVDQLARGLTNLLKGGVGLNTRVGAANLMVTLASELPFEMRKGHISDYVLTRALIPYLCHRSSYENNQYGNGSEHAVVQDPLVLQSYARAAAYLCPLAELATVRKYVRDGIFAFYEGKASSDEDVDVVKEIGTYGSRFLLVSALATKELVTKCPPITDANLTDGRNGWYCTDIFPAAFIGKFSSGEAIRSTWIEVLEELPPSILYADTSLESVLSVISRLIRNPAWDTRTQAIKALHAIFAPQSSYRNKISAAQTNNIWLELLSSVPGRLWRGKGVVLEALVAIAEFRDEEVWTTLSTLLLEECDRAWRNHDMEYLEGALLGISTLSANMPSFKQFIRLDNVNTLRDRLESWCMQDNAPDSDFLLPPMMVKAMIQAIGACWPTSIPEEKESSVMQMLDWLLNVCIPFPMFHVWSVRRAVFIALDAVVTSAPVRVLTHHQMVDGLIDRCCGDLGVGDAKYSMIRIAAGTVLTTITQRAQNSDDKTNDHQLALILNVHHEQLNSAIQTLRRNDEPKETQVATQILNHLSYSILPE